MDKHQIRQNALVQAIDYHSRTFGPVNYQNLHTQHGGTTDRRPSSEEIIATAQKFLGFLLLERKAQETRGKR